MSSQISIDDLLGKVVLSTDATGQETFRFSPGPFTVAFRDGTWLLLDELNLAQDTGTFLPKGRSYYNIKFLL